MPLPTPSATPADLPDGLLIDLKRLIDGARQRAVAAVNSELTLLYWSVGQGIHALVLAGRRAEYGQEILPKLALQLVRDYGQNFSEFSGLEKQATRQARLQTAQHEVL